MSSWCSLLLWLPSVRGFPPCYNFLNQRTTFGVCNQCYWKLCSAETSFASSGRYLTTTRKKIDTNLWELPKYPSSTLKTDQRCPFWSFLSVSCLWQYFVLLARAVTWEALCEGLHKIFWESSDKQCVLVFLYSIGFFLILERIPLLNRSTLCSVHLVLQPCENLPCAHAQSDSPSFSTWKVFGFFW